MKLHLLAAGIILFTTFIFSQQDVREENTKMEMFASKTGVIIKFVDFKLPNLRLTQSVAETKVRKLISGGETEYFFQISYKAKYNTKVASIAYDDLLEVSALTKLFYK